MAIQLQLRRGTDAENNTFMGAAGEVTVDMSNLKTGQHKVELKYNQASSSIEYKGDPSTATV